MQRGTVSVVGPLCEQVAEVEEKRALGGIHVDGMIDLVDEEVLVQVERQCESAQYIIRKPVRFDVIGLQRFLHPPGRSGQMFGSKKWCSVVLNAGSSSG